MRSRAAVGHQVMPDRIGQVLLATSFWREALRSKRDPNFYCVFYILIQLLIIISPLGHWLHLIAVRFLLSILFARPTNIVGECVHCVYALKLINVIFA